MKLGGQEGREAERERGRGGGGRERSSSAWNQSKKSIFNLAVRVAKLSTNCSSMDLITQNCPWEREDERKREVEEDEQVREGERERASERERWMEECELGDSKVTVWERDEEEEVARQTVTCRGGEWSVGNRSEGLSSRETRTSHQQEHNTGTSHGVWS